MPFPVDIAFVRRTESALGVELPASYVAAIQIENGGSIEASADAWEIHPVRDDSDRVRLKRTCNDVVHETAEARDWEGFPAEAVSIATNGCGDHLILLPDACNAARLGETVYEWSHETGEMVAVADSFARLRERQPPAPRAERRFVSMPWKRLEQAWFETVTDAIAATAASNPGERFYAGAFWLLYGDYASLQVPVFGLNAESSDPAARWHPPDWRWSIIDAAHERVRPLYQPLLALDVDRAAYDLLWEQHIDLLARVSRRVTELVRSNQLPVAGGVLMPGFFVGIIDFSHGDAALDYLRRSVDEATIAASGILNRGSPA